MSQKIFGLFQQELQKKQYQKEQKRQHIQQQLLQKLKIYQDQILRQSPPPLSQISGLSGIDSRFRAPISQSRLVPLTAPILNKMSTLLLFIVDESLSMRTRKQQIVDGINQFLDVQRQIEGPDARLILIKFNSVVTFLHKGTKLSKVDSLKLSEYNPGGRTACFDAIVRGVQTAEALRDDAERIVTIILTDGEDTASVENQVPKTVRKLVRTYEAKPDWSFTFIGRPPDAWCRQKPVSKVSYEYHISSSAIMSQRHKNVTSATRRVREFTSRRASPSVLISSQ